MPRAEMKDIGFADPWQRREQRQSTALIQLVATTALTLSITIVVTALSIGLALDHASLPAPDASAAVRHDIHLATLPPTSISAMAVPRVAHLPAGHAAL